MSLQDILSSPIEPWSNVYLNSINTNSIITPALTGPLTISANTASNAPILTIKELNSGASNFDVGVQVQNQSNSAAISLISRNDPSPSTFLSSSAGCIIETIGSTNNISLSPNQTVALQCRYISPSNTLTSIQQLSITGQQYLEAKQTLTQVVPNNTNTNIVFDSVVRNNGDISYNATTGVVTIVTTGVYSIGYTINFAGAADTNTRASWIGVSTGSQYGKNVGINSGAGPTNFDFTGCSPIYLASTNTLTVTVLQVSGGNLNVTNSNLVITRLS